MVLDQKTLSRGFLILFSTGTYAGTGTKCVESENVMKSTHTHSQKNTLFKTVFTSHKDKVFLVHGLRSELGYGQESEV